MTPREQRIAAKNFEPPEAKKGSTVGWHQLGIASNEPSPAMVISCTGKGILCLYAFTRNGGQVIQAVRHADDPMLNQYQREKSGCWGILEE
jgi:hypothetical protein